MSSEAPIEIIEQLTAALTQAGQPETTLKALDDVLARTVGHKLLTALLYRASEQVADRIYSSHPETFSATGHKSLAEAPTMKAVLETGQPHLSRTTEDVIKNFPDHQKIVEHGCGSVLNVPVRWNGRILGQINLLHQSGHYQEADIAFVESISQVVVPAFVAAGAQSAGCL